MNTWSPRIVSKETATDLAFAHREIEVAEELLKEMAEARERYSTPDIRDSFGRPVGGLQLGIPSGPTSKTLFHVPWSMAKPVIEAHIAACRARLAALTQKALIEAGGAE